MLRSNNNMFIVFRCSAPFVLRLKSALLHCKKMAAKSATCSKVNPRRIFVLKMWTLHPKCKGDQFRSEFLQQWEAGRDSRLPNITKLAVISTKVACEEDFLLTAVSESKAAANYMQGIFQCQPRTALLTWQQHGMLQHRGPHGEKAFVKCCWKSMAPHITSKNPMPDCSTSKLWSGDSPAERTNDLATSGVFVW